MRSRSGTIQPDEIGSALIRRIGLKNGLVANFVESRREAFAGLIFRLY
jgi:hypothetical protein